jgi:hypothetical protein
MVVRMNRSVVCLGTYVMLLTLVTMLTPSVESLVQNGLLMRGWYPQHLSYRPKLRLTPKKGKNSLNWSGLRRSFMTSSESSSSSENSRNVVEMFQDSDRFDRWRFLQELLEGDADPHVVNRLLYQVLEGAIKYPRLDGSGDWVVISAESKASIEFLLYSEDVASKDGQIIALHEIYENENVQKRARQALKQLEALLPTSDQDEDAVKSLWDTVMEIHGREAVKYQQTQDNTLEWRLRNTVARLLLHHDFLILGIVRASLQ